MAIPTPATIMHHEGDVFEEIVAGFRPEDFPHLLDLFNSPYANVIAAPIREYATNALDSHIAAGNSAPIEITLPTEGNLNFVVQDYGLGMDIDDLRNTYANYGASTKRDSNDFAGQLGLGCKSGLSYAEGFTITAVKDGVKVSAFFTKNVHGIGVIQVLVPPAPTTERNGVRIAIPVDGTYDMRRFRDEAQSLFRFWSPGTVLIDGEAPEAPSWLDSALALDDDTMLVRKDAGLESSYVIMGNVPYPIDDIRIGRETYRIVARLNIGDVDFVLSREDLKYTAHTEATLGMLADYAAEVFPRALATAKAATTTRWEETLLRVTWLGQNTVLRGSNDRKVWTYDPNAYHRKSKAHLTYHVSYFTRPNIMVVTGFTAKNVSVTARDRLTEFGGNKTAFVIIPDNVPTGMLDGRPNTYAWSDIVGLTKTPKADKVARGPKTETLYHIVQAGGTRGMMTAAQLATVSGTVLYLNPNERMTHDDLGATTILLYSVAQLARIQRFVPSVRHYSTEVDRLRTAAKAAITDTDRKIAQAMTLPHRFASLDPSKVNDPDLASYIRLAKAPTSVTMATAARFGVGIDHKPLPDYDSLYPLVQATSYHLSDAVAQAERLLYLNAKYAATQAAALAAAFSHGAVA